MMKRNRNHTSDDAELKEKINLLRVSDLQTILSNFQNISKQGRKLVLINRVFELFQNGSLREREFLKNLVIRFSMCSDRPQMPRVEASEAKKPKTHLELPTLPLQPDVSFKSIPFYEKLAVLLPPSTLTPTSFGLEQMKCFQFNLTPTQANEIDKNRVTKISHAEYGVQVQLRFCLMDTSEQNDLYPLQLQVRVNNKICTLPPFLPARPNTTPKRLPKPLNITPFVKISPMTTNTIEVRWEKEIQKHFVVACLLVCQQSANDLLQRLRIKGDDFTRGMIKEKLSKEVDPEIATTIVRVSLNCPLSKTRMNMPCRASTCEHLQCFDAISYLNMNELKQSWICPVCCKEALFQNLTIDGYFLNVIKSLSADVTEIQLNKNGTWSQLVEEVHSNNDEGFLISDDEDINNNVKPGKESFKPTNMKKEKTIISKKSSKTVISKQQVFETIDLTDE